MRPLEDVIERPLITEKGTLASEEGNYVLFRVRPWATKEEVRRAVEKLFDVRVDRVRTVNVLGKMHRVGRKQGRRPSWKKAYVKLATGYSIDFFGNA